MTKLDAVIFDLDGTLIDSAPDMTQAINATLVEYQRSPLSVDAIKKMLGDGLRATLERALKATGGTDSEVDVWMASFIRHYYAVPPDSGQIYPQVIETLEKLIAAGIKLGLCTNKTEKPTLRLLDHLKLRDYFEAIAGADTFKVHKPHPGHVLGVAEMLGVPASSCVMVGDSPNDVLAAKGAGIPTIVVAHGYGEGMEQYGADALIAGFGELVGALKKLGFTY